MAIPEQSGPARRALSWLAPRLRANWILAPIALLYIWSFPYFEGLNNPNELVRLYMTISIVDDGSYDIDPVCRRYTWVNDRSVVGDRAYSSKAPGASFAGVPVYLLVKAASRVARVDVGRRTLVWLLRLTTCVLPSLVFLCLFRRFLASMGYSVFVTDLVFVGYALGTPAFTYVHQFAGHVPSAITLFGAYTILTAARGGSGWSLGRAIAFGFLLGCAPVFEYQALVPAVAVGIAFLCSREARRPAIAIPALLGGAIPIGLMAHFHWVAFGSPIRNGYQFIENPAFQMMLSEGWLGLTYPRVGRLVMLLVGADTGLLVFSPFLAAAVLSPLALRVGGEDPGLVGRRRHAIVWGTAVVVSLLLFISANILWRAGWTAGPRYLTAFVPFAAVLALLGAGEAERRWGVAVRVPGLAAVLLSVFASGLSGMVFPHLPVTFPNPIFQLLVPMVRDGFLPENLGHRLFGLRGAWGYLPAVVLGLVPILVHLVRAAHEGWGTRISIMLTSALLAIILTRPLASMAHRSGMPPWGMDDLVAVYGNWQPMDGVSYLERNGCTAGKDAYSVTCPDRVTEGRVFMRMGLRWFATIRYRAGLKR